MGTLITTSERNGVHYVIGDSEQVSQKYPNLDQTVARKLTDDDVTAAKAKVFLSISCSCCSLKRDPDRYIRQKTVSPLFRAALVQSGRSPSVEYLISS
ncbi:MAG: hypothetical protein Tsb002_00430 [Wenzhouxiangellaceae bacterium]